MHPDRVLKWLMRANAAILLLAAVPMFFPTKLMAECNQWLGLESLHRAPLTEYLTRSLCAMYVMHGAVVWALSTDVRRYRPVIVVTYWLHLMFAFTMVGIDVFAGMPRYWLNGEGCTIGTVSVLALLVLRWCHRVEAQEAREAERKSAESS